MNGKKIQELRDELFSLAETITPSELLINEQANRAYLARSAIDSARLHLHELSVLLTKAT